MFKIKLNKEVYGRIYYGKGVITSVNKDAYFIFEVTYSNGTRIAYTEDGIPAWDQTLTHRTYI